MHETKLCPCCTNPFECRSGSITICQCMEVKISKETRELIVKQFDDCLCKECLSQIELYNMQKMNE